MLDTPILKLRPKFDDIRHLFEVVFLLALTAAVVSVSSFEDPFGTYRGHVYLHSAVPLTPNDKT